MKSIFFDLETSDKNPIGQILNYCFVLVDDDFSVLEELSGLVKISPTQLPTPGAILANRIDVREHQQAALDREPQAMLKISEFLVSALERFGASEKIPVIGYNSARFDIPFLRTSFIRNGINPYFNGRISPKDLLFVSRKLATCDQRFPRPVVKSGDSSRVSLSLENLCHEFSLLSGAQAHESRADVLLTIALAKTYFDTFGIDVRTFEAFEMFQGQEKVRRGDIRWALYPEYDPTLPRASEPNALVLLDTDGRSSLWIDLKRFAEFRDRRAISWYNHSAGYQLISASREAITKDERGVADEALEMFSQVTTKNFFSRSTCDIEQDIYRVDFDGINLLQAAIWRNAPDGIKNSSNRDLKVLYTRYLLAQLPFEGLNESQLSKLRAYAEYRYGGVLQLTKTAPDSSWTPEATREAFHPRFEELLSHAQRVIGSGGSTANDSGDEKHARIGDEALMRSLIQFYQHSPMNIER